MIGIYDTAKRKASNELIYKLKASNTTSRTYLKVRIYEKRRVQSAIFMLI